MATTQIGVIGIPDAKDKNRYTSCRYEITYNKSKSKKYGLNGGKIIRLTISVNGKVTASYDSVCFQARNHRISRTFHLKHGIIDARKRARSHEKPCIWRQRCTSES